MNSRRFWCFSFIVFLLAIQMGFGRPITLLVVSSPAFAEGKPIPGRYSFKRDNISPELQIKNVPAYARSLVLIVDDPDSPSGLWTHWLVWNLPPNTTSIPEGQLPPGTPEGKNSFGHVRYDGPSPPSGTHRYFFRIYALDTMIPLPAGAGRNALVAAMNDHTVGTGETFGTYQAGP